MSLFVSFVMFADVNYLLRLVDFSQLIANCGYLTSRAIDFEKEYKSLSKKDYKSWPAIALLTSLVSIHRICKYADPSCNFLAVVREPRELPSTAVFSVFSIRRRK